jgi:hypothetical protein
MKKLILATVLILSSAAFAVDSAKKEEIKADRLAVDSACTTESSTAGCGSEKVGTGLLKCIHAYKKEHKKDFKISDGCKSAMHKLKSDKATK